MGRLELKVASFADEMHCLRCRANHKSGNSSLRFMLLPSRMTCVAFHEVIPRQAT